MNRKRPGAAPRGVAEETPTPGATRARLLMMLRRSGVIDAKVLAAIERTPRDAFVPAMFRDRAYEDTALPIGNGQTISRPSVVAFMTAMLAPGPRMRGSGNRHRVGLPGGRAHPPLPQGLQPSNDTVRFFPRRRRGSNDSV